MMTRRAIGIACALCCLAGIAGCTNRLPAAPSDLTSGIVVYEHANFLGDSAHITADQRDLSDVRGPCAHDHGDGSYRFNWNDCISSVRVAPGWRATLYRDDGFRDDSIDLTTDHANLQLAGHDCPHDGLNDCVSSVRVRRQ
jgi:hypothetical protein